VERVGVRRKLFYLLPQYVYGGKTLKKNIKIKKSAGLKKSENMICKICGVNETDNPDGICDDCKMAMISDRDIPPNL